MQYIFRIEALIFHLNIYIKHKSTTCKIYKIINHIFLLRTVFCKNGNFPQKDYFKPLIGKNYIGDLYFLKSKYVYLPSDNNIWNCNKNAKCRFWILTIFVTKIVFFIETRNFNPFCNKYLEWRPLFFSY